MTPVRWTRRALRRLDQIGEYIASGDPGAATRVVGLVARRVSQLSINPEIGRPGRVPGTRELVVVGSPYIVAYRVHSHDLEILTVLHGAQAWPDDL